MKAKIFLASRILIGIGAACAAILHVSYFMILGKSPRVSHPETGQTIVVNEKGARYFVTEGEFLYLKSGLAFVILSLAIGSVGFQRTDTRPKLGRLDLDDK